MQDTEPTTLLGRTLGDLVAERPARARIFEQSGIDYCCHGGRTLVVAAAAAELDATALAQALADVSDTTDAAVDRLDPTALVEHLLSTHHAYLHAELPALRALAAKVVAVHGGRHPELTEVAELVDALADELEPHLAKEERVLFPAILRRAVDLDAPIACMEADHEVAGDLLAQLRATTRGYDVPADGCASYQALYGRLADLETDTFRHVHLENNVLFRAVLSAG